MRILFHTPYPLDRPASGSTVHPFRMREAFIAAGYDVLTICGSVLERRKQIAQLNRMELDRVSFCYSSPSSYPVHPVWDYIFYNKIKQAGLPLGIFYGDAYWLLAPQWLRQPPLQKRLLFLRYRLDLQIFRHSARVMFFSSRSIAKYFNFRRQVVIHPGAMNLDSSILIASRTSAEQNIAIYVGSITPRYGLDLLVQAFELVNLDNPVVLELVCPEAQHSEYATILDKYRHASWLKISHLTADQLEEKYLQSKIGIIPLRRNLYNDLAMPVKLFEYFSYGLPVIVTNCTEMAQFVSNTKTGLVTEDNPESLAQSILSMLENDSLYQSASQAVLRTINNGNFWKDRAKTVASVLLDENLSDC